MHTKRGFGGRRAIVVQFLLTAALLSSCSDEPSALNSVGTQFLQTQIVIKSDTLGTVSSSSFKRHVVMNGSDGFYY